MIVMLWFCGMVNALEPVPFTNAEIEKANACLKKSEHKDKLCVSGKKFQADDGLLYLAKCRTDLGKYYAVAFQVMPGKEWTIRLVLPTTDED